jgi:hypothetical protein
MGRIRSLAEDVPQCPQMGWLEGVICDIYRQLVSIYMYSKEKSKL